MSLPKGKRVFFQIGDETDFSVSNLTLTRPAVSHDELLVFDTAAGTITKEGKDVTRVNMKGYKMMRWNGIEQGAHRVLYEQHFGVKLTPEQHINHINFDKTDNRIENLELVTLQQNNQWRQLSPKNTTGYKGDYLNKNTGKYHAHIGNRNKRLHLGFFDDARSAALAYNAKAIELNQQGSLYSLNQIE